MACTVLRTQPERKPSLCTCAKRGFAEIRQICGPPERTLYALKTGPIQTNNIVIRDIQTELDNAICTSLLDQGNLRRPILVKPLLGYLPGVQQYVRAPHFFLLQIENKRFTTPNKEKKRESVSKSARTSIIHNNRCTDPLPSPNCKKKKKHLHSSCCTFVVIKPMYFKFQTVPTARGNVTSKQHYEQYNSVQITLVPKYVQGKPLSTLNTIYNST